MYPGLRLKSSGPFSTRSSHPGVPPYFSHCSFRHDSVTAVGRSVTTNRVSEPRPNLPTSSGPDAGILLSSVAAIPAREQGREDEDVVRMVPTEERCGVVPPHLGGVSVGCGGSRPVSRRSTDGSTKRYTDPRATPTRPAHH